MTVGVISIILGALFGIISFVTRFSVASASQQTVWCLGYVCSSIFLAGGFILIKIHSIGQELLKGNFYR
jgi:hypothetical protein